MKVIVALCLISVTLAAPNEPLISVFARHLEDFLGVIIAESGLKLEKLFRQYTESQEFGIATVYVKTTEFKDIVHEIQGLQEYKAILEYLNKNHIDLSALLKSIDEFIDQNDTTSEKLKSVSVDVKEIKADIVNRFVRENIDLLPKDKLAVLFEKKKTEDEQYRRAVESLESKEWIQLVNNLKNSEVVRRHVQALTERGIDVNLVVELFKAVFGQNGKSSNSF